MPFLQSEASPITSIEVHGEVHAHDAALSRVQPAIPSPRPRASYLILALLTLLCHEEMETLSEQGKFNMSLLHGITDMLFIKLAESDAP